MMIVDAPSQTQGDPLTAPGAGDSMQQCLIRFNACRVIELTRDYFNRPLPQKLLLDGLRNDE